MDSMSIIRLFGGLGLFIYGMTTMGDGLERLAGAKLEKTLEKVTGSFSKSLFMGIAVTALIQSSSASTVMVVGFVNAGIMSLSQSVGIILGANIGTTVTAQILRLDSTGSMSQNFFMQIIKPSNLAYLVVFCGIALLMVSKSKKRQDFASILIGFGILFIGMSTMERSVSPLADVPEFQNLFAYVSNPLTGVLVGALVTAIIQSSSASVGILQAIATTGIVSYSSAIPIILGQNIGTCVTAFISSIGASRNAKRVGMIHFYFNMIGSIIFIAVIYSLNGFFTFNFWDMPIDKAGIANFHTIFNVVATILFIPFNKKLVLLSQKTIKDKDDVINPLARLDTRFYQSSSLALEQCHKCIIDMSSVALENFTIATSPIFDNVPIDYKTFKKNETFLDKAEVEIGKYLLGISKDLTDKNRKSHTQMLYTLSDFEKVGDYCQNIIKAIELIREKQLSFSKPAFSELLIMRNAVHEVLKLTCSAYKNHSSQIALSVEPIEEVVDTLKSTLKSNHIERLNKNLCSIDQGIVFLEIVHDFEKISDHCSNIAIYTVQLLDEDSEFDTHSYEKSHSVDDEQFREQYEFYNAKYFVKNTRN